MHQEKLNTLLRCNSMLKYLLNATWIRLNRRTFNNRQLYLPACIDQDNLTYWQKMYLSTRFIKTNVNLSLKHIDQPETILESFTTWIVKDKVNFDKIIIWCEIHQIDKIKNWFDQSKTSERIRPVLSFRVCLDWTLDKIPDQNPLTGSFSSKLGSLINDLSTRINIYFTFKTTYDNCHLAEDIYQDCRLQSKKLILFYPCNTFIDDTQKSNIKNNASIGFTNLLFYESLKSSKIIGLAERLFYSKIVTILNPLHLTKKVNSVSITESISLKNRFYKNYSFSIAKPNIEFSDYFDPVNIDDFFIPRFTEITILAKNLVLNSIKNYTTNSKKIQFATSSSTIPIQPDPTKWKKVLITGWYGTETNGDKAILGEIVHFIKSCSPDCKIILTTIYPSISHQTNFELPELKDATLISIYEPSFRSNIRESDAVIMGGGPIMETSELFNVLRIFEEANIQKKARIIFGCGLGPFHHDKTRLAAKRIIEITTAGFLRDKESWDFANSLVPENLLHYACDPAIGFIYRWKKRWLAKNNSLPIKQKKIIGLLRANTGEFFNMNELSIKNSNSARQIASILEPFCMKTGLNLELLHMNAPWIGGDDRSFNRLVEKEINNKDLVCTERSYLTLEEHIEKILSADLGIAMRYHGHIFCMVLGIPFLSIDYTGANGKVGSLVKRIGYEKWSTTWDQINPDNVAVLIQELISERELWSKHLLEQTEILVDQLYSTYLEVFNVTTTK